MSEFKYLESQLSKESDEINKRIGIKVDEECIKNLDRVSKVGNIVANRFLSGDHFDDWDEEFKKEWDFLEGK